MKVSGVPDTSTYGTATSGKIENEMSSPVKSNTKTLQSCLNHAPTERGGNFKSVRTKQEQDNDR